MGDRHPRRPRPLRHRRHRQPAAGGPANNIDELQALCDQFRWHYNHQRPHQSLGKQVPAKAYQALPKVGPGDPRPRRRDTDPRVLLVSPTEASTTANARSASASNGRANGSPSSTASPITSSCSTAPQEAVLRELILARSGPTTATAESVTDLARTQKPHRRRCFSERFRGHLGRGVQPRTRRQPQSDPSAVRVQRGTVVRHGGLGVQPDRRSTRRCRRARRARPGGGHARDGPPLIGGALPTPAHESAGDHGSRHRQPEADLLI